MSRKVSVSWLAVSLAGLAGCPEVAFAAEEGDANRSIRAPVAAASDTQGARPAVRGGLADLAAQVAQMRAQMQAMGGRIEALEAQLAEARIQVADARAQATRPVSATPPVTVAQAPAQLAQPSSQPSGQPPAEPASLPPTATVAWRGAPQFTGPNGWSFKPRGRLQVDLASIDGPAGLSGDGNAHLGTAAELRRAYLGFDGTMPGGIGYRLEADFSSSNVAITDMFVTYDFNKALRVTVGQHKPFWGLEEMTSDLFTSMMERASFTQAFNFERRVGASLQYRKGIVLAQGGVFGDNASALNDDMNRNWSLDGRLVLAPRIGSATLHLGGSIHRNHNSVFASSQVDRARPFAHTTDLRLVTSGPIAARGDTGLGLEAAYIDGRFHATSETYWQTIDRIDGANPTFNGGYAEAGYLLTGDKTAYRNGTYDRIRPRRGIDQGGPGAIQVNVRYDWLDLNSAGIAGGRQQTASVSTVWMMTDYVRLIADYGHVWIKGSSVTDAGGNADYQLDVIGMRAQYDF